MNSNNKASTCLWRGHKDEGCDATAVEGRSYCELHLWRVYSKGTAVRPRPRKDRQQQAAEGTREAAVNVASMSETATKTSEIATHILGASGDLAAQSETLKTEVEGFLSQQNKKT